MLTLPTLLLALTLPPLAAGCDEAPDVVAIAALVDDGGVAQPRTGGSDTTSLDAAVPPIGSGTIDGDCDLTQALIDARVPVETLLVATSCEVPLFAVQPMGDQPAPQELVAELLNARGRLEDEPGSPASEQCEGQPNRWYIEGDTVYLCRDLCDFVGRVVSDLVQASCDAAARDGGMATFRPGGFGGAGR